MRPTLTERGRGAAQCVRSGVLAVDRECEGRVGAEGVAALSAGPVALWTVCERMEGERGA